MRASAVLLAVVCFGSTVQADVLVRWDQPEVPSRAVLGVSSVVVPATNAAAIESAGRQGYEVYIEHASEPRLTPRHDSPSAGEIVLDRRGKWPHIRPNWVARSNVIAQVATRTAQPWIENNAALLRILQTTGTGPHPMLTYAWTPVTRSETEEGPAIENYLVAIAEAGSFGGNVLLPLHPRLQKDLLLGKPQARAAWNDIRRYVEFYADNLPRRYRRVVDVGVVAAEPMRAFEIMNLLARHNVPFDVIDPKTVSSRDLTPFKLLIVPDQVPDAASIAASFGPRGLLVTTEQSRDPNKLALEIRRTLGREARAIDIWNGITVIAAPYADPEGRGMLVTAVNYTYQPLPVQMRVRGTFSRVQYESPEQEPLLLPHEQRNGFTEFVIPALRVGGRVFLH
jgi:hypothetical protein